MSPKPTISIVTPTHNRREVLERAIHSVLRQTRDDYELLIIDDASEDGTDRLVKGISDHRIRYFRFSEWRGANPARNLGISEARGKWVAFLDSDDEYLPHRLESVLSRCEGEPELGLHLSSFRNHKKDTVTDVVNPDVRLAGAKLEQALMTYALSIAGTSITATRELLIRAGGFAPTLLRLQDREALLRMSQFTGARVSSEVDWVKHRSDDSISGREDGYIEAVDAMLGLHTDVATRYRGILSYHVSRRLLSDLLKLRLGTATKAWRANRRSASLRFALGELLLGYARGKKQRAMVALSIRQSDSMKTSMNHRYASPRMAASRRMAALPQGV